MWVNFSLTLAVRLAKAPFRVNSDEPMQKILKREDEVLKLAALEDADKLHYLEGMVTRLVDKASVSIEFVDEERQARIIRWLSTTAYAVHHETVSERRLEDFGQWLLKTSDYRDWYQSSSPAVFLLHGIPGSGKTHLCSVVIDSFLNMAESQSSLAPFAYFYCSKTDSEPERASADNILRSLLRQLAITGTKQPAIRDFLSTEFDRRSKSARLSGLDLPRLRPQECINLIMELANDDPITVIIDAIDEVRIDDRVFLFDALKRILSKAANVVKLFITSRTDKEILSALPLAKPLALSSSLVRQDMRNFIHQGLDNIRLLNGPLSSDARTALTNALLNGAGEM